VLGKSNVYATIAVKDLDVAKKFYEGTLGLEQENESPGGVMYKSGNSKVFVYPSGTAGTNQATYATWTINDVEGAIKVLKDKGVSFEQYDSIPGVKRDGDLHIMGSMKSAWFKDPSGNILALVNEAE
jgi:catechol 2,3-dioxygenase-like lactoylglutathione lyase family enzyme